MPAPLLPLANQEEFGPLIGAGLVVVALVLLWPYIRCMRRRRLLLDIPTSKAGGVTLGLSELKGSAEECEPMTSHLAETPVVHYRWTCEEHWRRTESYTDSKGNRRTRTRSGWSTMDSGGETAPFRLQDDTGSILVRPAGADITDACIYAEECTPDDPLYYGKGPAHATSHSTYRRRFTEEAITVGQQVYVMGPVRPREDVAEPEVASDPRAALYLISVESEEQIVRGYAWGAWISAFFGLAAAVGAPVAFMYDMRSDPSPATIAMPALGGILYLLFLLGLHAAGLYNGLIGLRERVRRAWAMVEVELQRRADLIPNLADAVKAYAAHERDLQEGLSRLRNRGHHGAAGLPSNADLHAGTEAAGLQALLGARLLAVAERYPQLKADQAFLELAENLRRTEDRLALGRSFYNASVQHYNARLQRVPDHLFARLGRFLPMAYYQLDDAEARQAVKVRV